MNWARKFYESRATRRSRLDRTHPHPLQSTLLASDDCSNSLPVLFQVPCDKALCPAYNFHYSSCNRSSSFRPSLFPFAVLAPTTCLGYHHLRQPRPRICVCWSAQHVVLVEHHEQPQQHPRGGKHLISPPALLESHRVRTSAPRVCRHGYPHRHPSGKKHPSQLGLLRPAGPLCRQP